jgi:hypothetical protein
MNVPSSSRATRAVFHDLSDRHVGTVHNFHMLPQGIYSSGFSPDKQRYGFLIRPFLLVICHGRLLVRWRSCVTPRRCSACRFDINARVLSRNVARYPLELFAFLGFFPWPRWRVNAYRSRHLRCPQRNLSAMVVHPCMFTSRSRFVAIRSQATWPVHWSTHSGRQCRNHSAIIVPTSLRPNNATDGLEANIFRGQRHFRADYAQRI